MIAQLHGKEFDHHHPVVLKQKKDIDDALMLEEADGPWRIQEIFKNGPLKIRRRFILVIGRSPSVLLCLVSLIVANSLASYAATERYQCSCKTYFRP